MNEMNLIGSPSGNRQFNTGGPQQQLQTATTSTSTGGSINFVIQLRQLQAVLFSSRNHLFYVQWSVSIPQNWTLDASSTPYIQGSTQRCFNAGGGDITINYDIKLGFTQYSLDSHPIVHFNVKSLDSYTRSSFEGYSYLPLSHYSSHTIKDVQEISLICYRPALKTVNQKLRNYFLGTCIEYVETNIDSQSTTATTPHQHQNFQQPLNKYGQYCEYGCRLAITVTTAAKHQHHLNSNLNTTDALLAAHKENGKDAIMVRREGLMGGSKSSVALTSQTDIIRAVERARKRLTEIRNFAPASSNPNLAPGLP